MKHETGEGQEVQASQRGGEPFAVARQAAEPSGAGEATFNDPPFGQEHEAHGRVLEQGRARRQALVVARSDNAARVRRVSHWWRDTTVTRWTRNRDQADTEP